MKILEWLGLTEAKEEDADKKFSIEHYPLTNKYFPKYKNYYLQKHYLTGIVEAKEPFLFQYADSFRTEEGCYKLIELFKEQQLKENVETIEYKNNKQ